MNNGYAFLFARAIDVLCCTWIWRQVDITISSMAGLELRKPAPARWARVLGWVLNHLQKNHCEIAIDNDRARAKAALRVLGA